MRDNRTFFPVLLCVPHNGDGRQLWDQLLRGHPRSGGNNFYDKLETRMKKDKSKYWWWMDTSGCSSSRNCCPVVGQQRCFDAGEVTFILKLFPNQSDRVWQQWERSSCRTTCTFTPDSSARPRWTRSPSNNSQDHHKSDVTTNYLGTYLDRL